MTFCDVARREASLTSEWDYKGSIHLLYTVCDMHILHFTQFGSEREIMTEIWTICQLQAKAVILLVICVYSSNRVSVYDLFNKKKEILSTF